jgi:hypothetical protein
VSSHTCLVKNRDMMKGKHNPGPIHVRLLATLPWVSSHRLLTEDERKRDGRGSMEEAQPEPIHVVRSNNSPVWCV